MPKPSKLSKKYDTSEAEQKVLNKHCHIITENHLEMVERMNMSDILVKTPPLPLSNQSNGITLKTNQR